MATLDNDTFGGSIGGSLPPSGAYPYPGTAPVLAPLMICPKCRTQVFGDLSKHFCMPIQGQTVNGYPCQKCGVYIFGGVVHTCANKPKTTDISFDVKIDCDEERLDRLLEKLERLAELREKLKT